MRTRRIREPIDMCNGAIIPQLLRFSLPMMFTSVLQLLYNTADLVVIGNFAGDTALAAVGANSSLVSLFINLIIGLSIGTNVVIAQTLGAEEHKRARSLAHSALIIAALCGVALSAVCLVFAEKILILMSTPADVLPAATVYLRILACGFPFNLLYNFAASILRACGDPKKPLYFLLVSGALKIALNLLFVALLHIDVVGVALATIISQLLSAILAVIALSHMHNPCRLHIKDLKLNKEDVKHILKIGIPAGIQSACFSLANVVIQSAINGFGTVAIAGNTAGYNLECFVFAFIDAGSQACLSFVGRNVGAKRYDRVPRIIGAALLICGVITVVLAGLLVIFPTFFLSFYTSDPAVIAAGTLRNYIVCTPYLLVVFLYIYSYSLRAMGYSTLPMLICVGGVCGVRLLFVFTVLKKFHYLQTLFASFPISWIVSFIAVFIAYRILYRRQANKVKEELLEA
ncbi:MAG: MATE family efflux transporter [Clostridia bacterium]|nr:MATE family efflux transporter [Clostridia bacterium]